MTSLSFVKPLAQTLISNTAGSCAGCMIGHLYGCLNRQNQKPQWKVSSHIAGYALTAFISYGIARVLSPPHARELHYQSAAIAISSLISSIPFFNKWKHPLYIKTAVITPIVTSFLLPRPVASVANTLILHLRQYSMGQNEPAEVETIQTTTSYSYWIVVDVIATSTIAALAAVEGSMSQSKG